MKTIKEQLKKICDKRNVGMDDVSLQYCKYQDVFEVYYNESLDSTPWLVEIGFIKLKQDVNNISYGNWFDNQRYN